MYSGAYCAITHLPIYMQDRTAGPIAYSIYTSMLANIRLLCYDSYTMDPDVKDQLGLCSEHYSALALGIRFYIRENRVSLALLADPLLEARPLFDLYI
jgi:hypothetical protein